MTDITLEKQPARRFDFSRLFTLFIRPRRAFEEMASEARASWLTPMLVLTLTAILVVLVSGYLKTTSLWLGWVIVAGLLHLGSTLLGGRRIIQNKLNIVAWASLPFVIRDLLRVAYMLMAKHIIANPSLSGFATSSGFFSQLLARLDLFVIWYIVLLIIGMAIADGLTRGKAVAGVALVILLVVLAQAGLGTLTSGFGGQAVQRPFF